VFVPKNFQHKKVFLAFITSSFSRTSFIDRGSINNLGCFIFCRFFENNIANYKAPECSFSGIFSGHDQIKPEQEQGSRLCNEPFLRLAERIYR
jgi:hypothetical protein